MNLNKHESGNMAIIAVAVVVSLVIGYAVGKTMDNNNSSNNSGTKSSSVPTSATKAADLRSNLVTMGLEHMSLTNVAVDGALDGSKTAEATRASLYANGNDIGAAVGSVYGKQAEMTFDSVWKLHLDQFVKYAVASSNNDATGKKAAMDTITTGYTKPLAQFLAKANPNLPEAALESALGEHIDMTATMIDDHVAGKYTAEQAELKNANQHITTIFSTLAGGIVKQYPAKFQN